MNLKKLNYKYLNKKELLELKVLKYIPRKTVKIFIKYRLFFSINFILKNKTEIINDENKL